MNDVMRLVKSYGTSEPVSITAQEFDNTCRLTLSLPLDILPSMAGRLDAISGTSVECPENY